MRNIIRSEEFDQFYGSLPEKVQTKIDYALMALASIKVINKKLAKRLITTNFYELRINSNQNEYRIVIFTIDKENLIEAENVLLLNGFMKKSTKDYVKAVLKAQKILKELSK